MYFKVFSFYNTQGKETKRREGGREKEKPKKNWFQSLHIIYYIKHHTFSSLQACIKSLFGSVWNCCVFKNLTIIALKLNHLYVLQDQMVKVGVCLQALCIRFFSCFLVQSWIFQLTKKAMRNETRLDFTDSWTIRLHSTIVLHTCTREGLGPKK